MRRRYFNSKLINNKIIIYTSADNLIVVPFRYNFGANVITNIINNNIGKITFDRDITTIGDYAFNDCTSLENINIPESVTEIGSFAFDGCKSLTSVTIPDSVTTIGEGAFFYCDSLTSVTIGNSVTTIGNGAFWGCNSLTSVYCEATTPPSLGGTYVFDNNGLGRKIYVPTGSVNVYKSATNWREYASDIVGYNF